MEQQNQQQPVGPQEFEQPAGNQQQEYQEEPDGGGDKKVKIILIVIAIVLVLVLVVSWVAYFLLKDQCCVEGVTNQQQDDGLGNGGNEVDSNCDAFPDKLELCESYKCEFTHPITQELMQRQITGYQGDNCNYIEEMPNSGQMECNFPKDSLEEYARFYRDSLSARTHGVEVNINFTSGETETKYTINGVEVENPLQEAMINGQCMISGYGDLENQNNNTTECREVYNKYIDSPEHPADTEIINLIRDINSSFEQYINDGYYTKIISECGNQNLLFLDSQDRYFSQAGRISEGELHNLGKQAVLGVSNGDYSDIDFYHIIIDGYRFEGTGGPSVHFDQIKNNEIFYTFVNASDSGSNVVNYIFDTQQKINTINTQTTYSNVLNDLNTYRNYDFDFEFKYPNVRPSWPEPMMRDGIDSYQWTLDIGIIGQGPCEGADCSQYLLSELNYANYDSKLNSLRNDQFITDIEESIINGLRAISFTEHGLRADQNVMIFGPTQTFIFTNVWGNVDVFDEMVKSFTLLD